MNLDFKMKWKMPHNFGYSVQQGFCYFAWQLGETMHLHILGEELIMAIKEVNR